MDIIKEVKKELTITNEYDFDSEFWIDEINVVFDEVIVATQKVVENLTISDVSGRLSDMDNVKSYIEDALYQSNAGDTDVCMQLTGNIIKYLKDEGILFINNRQH